MRIVARKDDSTVYPIYIADMSSDAELRITRDEAVRLSQDLAELAARIPQEA